MSGINWRGDIVNGEMEYDPEGYYCVYDEASEVLARRTALLREAAEAIEDAATGWPQPNRLDDLAARIRKELGE